MSNPNRISPSTSSALFRSAPRDEQAIQQRTRRLALSVGLCAGALGAAVAIISVIARVKFYETPEHPPLGESIYLGTVGFLAGLIVIATLFKLIGIDAYRPRNLLIWLLVGLLYAVTLSFITGALLPPTAALLAPFTGQTSLPGLLPALFDSLFVIPWAAVTQGFIGLPPALPAGALLALAAWLIDRAACAQNPALATRGALTIGIIFALTVLLFTALAPPTLLSRLAWGPS